LLGENVSSLAALAKSGVYREEKAHQERRVN